MLRSWTRPPVSLAEPDVAFREKLQDKLRVAKAAISSLETISGDPDVAKLLAFKKQRLDDIRAKLHAARRLK